MKARTEHTPGPWSNTPLQPTIWANDGELKVAIISDLPWINGKSDWMTEQANARLIAAAPEMLEALEKIYNSPYSTCSCAEIAKAAIAKAKGTT